MAKTLIWTKFGATNFFHEFYIYKQLKHLMLQAIILCNFQEN